MKSSKHQRFIKEDLAYELRMLLGAAKMTQLFEKRDMGNPTNFFKDSVYLHARNLYNFFWGDTEHDASVRCYTSHIFDVKLYEKWKKPLHNHALHVRDSRLKANNMINGVHINEVVQEFADDIKKLWQDWIDCTVDPATKTLFPQNHSLRLWSDPRFHQSVQHYLN